MNSVAFELVSMDDSRATYTFRELLPEEEAEAIEGMFELDIERYQQLEASGDTEAMDHAIYWLTPIQEDRQYWLGMKVFFRVYKHYLEHGAYIESSGQPVNG